MLGLPELIEQHHRSFENGLNVSIRRGGRLLGGDTWKSAYCLQRYMQHNVSLVRGKRICELGAGTGYLTMSLHLLGAARSVATDRGEVVGLLKENIRENEALLQAGNSSGIVEVVLKALLMQNNLAPDWWWRAAYLLNRFPPVSADVSVAVDGDRMGPMEIEWDPWR